MMSEPEIKNFTWKNIGYWWETYLVVSLWVSWLPKVIFTEWCCRVINAWYVTLRPGQPRERERERERERDPLFQWMTCFSTDKFLDESIYQNWFMSSESINKRDPKPWAHKWSWIQIDL